MTPGEGARRMASTGQAAGAGGTCVPLELELEVGARGSRLHPTKQYTLFLHRDYMGA